MTYRIEETIKEWPESERPREMLLSKGPRYVSDAGLIAILLRSGTKGKNAVSLGRELLARFGGLKGLLGADRKEIEKVRGLGSAKIAQLLAAIELSKRQLKEEIVGKTVIQSPEDLMDYLTLSMHTLKKEVFKVVYLNKANAVITIEEMSSGTVDRSVIYTREVIKRALELDAHGLIFVHNHPTGNLKPSRQDRSLTDKLASACKAVDLVPLDHLIIGPSGFCSFRNLGLL